MPARYRNPRCGKVTGDGNQGGFKLWQTNGVTIEDNYIHNNWGPGVWADTDNANTTYAGNTITDNDGEAIIEEISYNFSITNNYLATMVGSADWVTRNSRARLSTLARAVATRCSAGYPACQEASCNGQGSYPSQSVISENTFVNNGGNVFLWQNSDRFCSAEFR